MFVFCACISRAIVREFRQREGLRLGRRAAARRVASRSTPRGGGWPVPLLKSRDDFAGDLAMARRKARACPEGPLWTRAKETVPWSLAVAEAIVARVAAGEVLYAVLREEGM